MNSGKILALVVMVAAAACGPKTTTSTSTTTPSGKYSEDLSALREKFPPADSVGKNLAKKDDTVSKRDPMVYVEPKHAVNGEVDTILDSIARTNLQMGFVDGYTIQVYSGVRSEEALKVKKDMATQLPDVTAEILYVQPNFRVRVGRYYDRYEAQKDYQAIKKFFPNAIILPDRIPIND